MQLIRAHITNFRSVEDSGEFAVDQTTCLVGKNEAGKSAILLALAALNPHPLTPAILDKERDYPRRFLNDYEERHGSTPATATTTTWKLDSHEVAEIEAEFGPGTLKSHEVVVLRRYGDTSPRWRLDVDAKQAVQNFLVEHGISEDFKELQSAGDFPELLEALAAKSERSEAENKAHAALAGKASTANEVATLLSDHLPTFMYFASYDRMAAIATIDQLQQAKANASPQDEIVRGQKLFAEFFDYANVPLKDVVAATTFETF
jgi:ABC-type cobalamin/Fe3+-siderophores transport system ATPase subunit